MRIEEDVKLNFKDVLLKPKRSELNSRAEVDLLRKYTFKHSKQIWTGVPIVAANLHTVGTFAMYEALKKNNFFTCIHKHYTKVEWRYFLKSLKMEDDYNYFAVTSGIKDTDYNRFQDIMKMAPEIKFICFDLANGYSQRYADFIKRLREEYPDKTIIAGNVVTGEMTEELILAGADIIRVGVGQNANSKTRFKTGVGYPQLSAIIECADVAHGLKAHILSDGGCLCQGDIPKAFAAGADFVMSASLFSGHDENGGDIVTDKDNPHHKYKIFYGTHKNKKKDADDNSKYGITEGENILVDYKGPVQETVDSMLDGLRSTCAYMGAFSLKEISRRATFIKINNSSNYDYLLPPQNTCKK